MRTPEPPYDFPPVAGLMPRKLTLTDTAAVMALQAAMLAALPDRTWYYPSPEALFAACIERGESYGYFDGDRLAGFGTLTPGNVRAVGCYAAKIGEPVEASFDFQDVMVAPEYRRRGIHTALLALFERMSRAAGGRAIYCTIAPDNVPSVSSFVKAGYACVRIQPAYEGMLRGYYCKYL